MHNFVHDMLHASPAALRIEALWEVRPMLSFSPLVLAPTDRVTLLVHCAAGVVRGDRNTSAG